MKRIIIIVTCLLVFGFSFAQDEVKQDTIQNKLDEVVVKGIKKTFSNTKGNLKIDVANSILNSVPNIVDLLAKLPKVMVSSNKESISIAGKGAPLLYLDNQKIEMNELNSLAVEDIKTIEIINNPSSKYEANGRVVILITRKLNKKEGFQMAVTENASFKKYFNNYFGVNSSVKKRRMEFKTNFNYNQLNIWESNGNDFTVPGKEIVSNYLTKAITKRPQFVFGSGIFYKINEDDYFSFNFNGRLQKEKFDITTVTYNKDKHSENNILTFNVNDSSRDFYNAFINYNRKIKSIDGVVFTGFQYSDFNQNVSSLISNDYNNTGFESSQNRKQEFNIRVFSGRFDFEKKFKNQMKLEFGALYLEANADTDFFAENFNPFSTASSQYNYNEKNSAGYSQLSGSLKKASYSIGLRVENTIVSGKYKIGNGPSIDKNTTDYFPKLQLEFPLDSTKTMTFNYAKSIIRPNFSSTSHVSAYINPYFIISNNINLNPTITDEIAVNFQYTDKSVRFSYNKKSNPVYYGSSYDESQNLLILKPINFEKESGFNLEFTIPFRYEFWSNTNVLSATLNKVEDNTAIAKEAKPYLYYYSSHNFKLPKETELSISGWGLTRQQEGIFDRKAVFTVDLAASKTFFKQFDCTLSYNDIFKKLKYYENFTTNSVTSKGKYFIDNHMLSLSVKYSFGKIKDSEFKEKSINENENRIR